MSGGGGSAPSQQTVTQTREIPEWQRQYAQENEAIAASLASRPFPLYEGELIAGFTPMQQAGTNMAADMSTAYQPNLGMSEQMTAGAATPWNPAAAMQFMSPYAMAALAPQMQQLQLQQDQQRKRIGAGATAAGAYGDARHGVSESLNDFYGNLAMNDLVSQGMNTAYNTGLQAFLAQEQQQLAAAQQMAQLAEMQQRLGLSGATALFGAGTQEQQLNQQLLNAAYQNFQNQVNWPVEMLNLRIAALANSPYNIVTQQSLAPGNATASNIGAFAALAGGLGSLLGGGQGGRIYGGG